MARANQVVARDRPQGHNCTHGKIGVTSAGPTDVKSAIFSFSIPFLSAHNVESWFARDAGGTGYEKPYHFKRIRMNLAERLLASLDHSTSAAAEAQVR